MSITLVVNNTPFEYPEQGEPQGWGEAATAWANEVTKVLASVSGPADILETSDTIINSPTEFRDIVNFKFDSSTVRSFSVRGNVNRTHGASEKSEEFLLIGVQDATGWLLQQEGIGDAGITFGITSLGQVQYKSTNLVGGSGIIKFRGVGILKN